MPICVFLQIQQVPFSCYATLLWAGSRLLMAWIVFSLSADTLMVQSQTQEKQHKDIFPLWPGPAGQFSLCHRSIILSVKLSVEGPPDDCILYWGYL